MPLPAEILLHTASYLPLRELESLSSSCQFFYQNETIWRKIAKQRTEIKLVSSGENFSFVLLQNGQLFAFGANGDGQLGLGNRDSQSTPQLISMPTGARPCQVSAGAFHSLILCDDGSVYGFGENAFGQLGLGHRNRQSTPQLISMPMGARPCQISAGSRHSFILCDDGSLYGFGENDYGQLGLGHRNRQSTPQLIPMPLEAKPRQISTGSGHILILCDDGSVYGFGYNTSGQLGLGNKNNQSTPQLIPMPLEARPCQVCAGYFHSFILCQDGSVYGFGANGSGQLGFGYKYEQSTPQLISMPMGARPCQISAGCFHSFILCQDARSVYGFGDNGRGELGLGHENYQPTPQLISFFSIGSQENKEEKTTCCVM